MSDIEEVAAKFKSWASENGILTYQPPEEDLNYDGESITDLTDANEPASATTILNRKKINLVAVDPENKKIIVCTHRKISTKELEELPERAEGGFEFHYIKAHPPQVRMPVHGATAAGTYAVHNGRYTCGSSISVGNCVSAGTLGCLLQDNDGGLFGLTNNHVTGGCGYSNINIPIVAPGLVDVRPAGHDPFTIGHHHKVSPWISGSPENVDVASNLDAAIFVVKDPNAVTSMQRSFYDTPPAVMDPRVGIEVEKVGRTTGRTKGIVVGKTVGCEPVGMQVPEFRGVIYFSEIYLVQGIGSIFADSGDSGSLVCFRPPGQEAAAFGLVFAVSADKSLTFVVPLNKILKVFNMKLVSAHNV